MNNGQWKPGQSGNPKGRPRGARDRTAEQFRAMVKQFVADNWEGLQEKYDALEDKDQAMFLERLLKHIIPAPLDPVARLTQEQIDQVIIELKKRYHEN